MSQEMLQAAFATIRKVAATPSKNEKIEILQAGDSPYLKRLLLATYNRFRTYGVKKIEYPNKYAAETPDIMEPLEALLEKLYHREYGKKDSVAKIKTLLAKCTEEDAKIVAAIILKDIRAGIDEKTVNQAFPLLVPMFGVQLAYPLDKWDRVTFPAIVEDKLDGIRMIGMHDGEETRFFSRKGFEFPEGFDAFGKEVHMLMPGVPKVVDGEFIAVKFNPNNAVCQKYKDGNWQFEYANSVAKRKRIDPEEIRTYFKFYIWDVVTLEYFSSQGQLGMKYSLEERKRQLLAMFERYQNNFQCIEMVPNYIVHSIEEVVAFMRGCKEGCMVKMLHSHYTFNRGYHILKLKHFAEGDFRVIGVLEGEKKYEGHLGALLVTTDDTRIISRVGSGFTDDQREEIYLKYLRGEIMGDIVEVKFKDVTDTSLQLPIFHRFRYDKITTDTYNDLQQKLAMLREVKECE